MKLKQTELLKPGEKIAKSIYDNQCKLLLAKSKILTDQYIKRLLASNIPCVYVSDPLTDHLEFDFLVEDELRIRSVNHLKDTFDQIQKNQGNQYATNSFSVIGPIVEEILDSILEQPECLYRVSELMGTDMYTYTHSVEVSILSMLVAKRMGLTRPMISKVGIGAMLHDLGKTQVDTDILNKRSELTLEEWDTLKGHPRYGYQMLKESDVISPISRQIVLLHHEKLDGSGYPFGFKGDEIPLTVRIVTLCDMYNALTSNRAYRSYKNINKALEILQAESIYKLDRSVYHCLLDVVNLYPVGTRVVLNDDRQAMVIKENRMLQTRPVVQIIEDNERREIVDLMAHLTVFIETVL